MKPIHYIITASLILNAALFIYTKPFATRAPVAPSKTPAQKSRAQTTPAINLQTATPAQLIQKFTAMGFSPGIVRAIVLDRMQKILNDKKDSVYDVGNPRYWKVLIPELNGFYNARPGTAEFNKLAESTNEYNEAFGKLNNVYPDMETLRRTYGDIPGISDEQMLAIFNLGNERNIQWNMVAKKVYQAGVTDADKTSQFGAVNQKYYDKLSQILTPDQLSEYNMRVGPASDDLSYKIRFLDVNASSLIIVGKNRVFRSEIGWLSGSFRMIGNRARLILSSVSLS